jgi:hypothetical protein
MFRDNVPTSPEVKLTLGQYLGPVTNVGSALTAKILKSNGQTVCRSTLQHLDNQEIHCLIHQEMCREFNESITHHLGSTTTEQDFPVEDLTPDYDFYEGNHDLDPDHGNLEVTPEMGDKYLRAEISIPRGGTLVKGRVTPCKRGKDGNPIGLANTNPILNTCMYPFIFDNGDETIMNANLIAEAIYVQCNPSRNNMFSLIQLLTIDRMTL